MLSLKTKGIGFYFRGFRFKYAEKCGVRVTWRGLVSSISSGRPTFLPSLVWSCCCVRADRNQEAALSAALSIGLDDSGIPPALILQVPVDLHFLADFPPLTEWYGPDCYPTATNTLLLRSLHKVVLFDSIMIKFAIFHFQDFTPLFNLWTLCSWQYHHISPWKMHSRRKKRQKWNSTRWTIPASELPQSHTSRRDKRRMVPHQRRVTYCF